MAKNSVTGVRGPTSTRLERDGEGVFTDHASFADGRVALVTFYEAQEQWYLRIADRFPDDNGALTTSTFLRQVANAISRFADDHRLVRLAQGLLEVSAFEWNHPPVSTFEYFYAEKDLSPDSEYFDSLTRRWALQVLQSLEPDFYFRLQKMVRLLWGGDSDEWEPYEPGSFTEFTFSADAKQRAANGSVSRAVVAHVTLNGHFLSIGPTVKYLGMEGQVYGDYELMMAEGGHAPEYEFDVIGLFEQLGIFPAQEEATEST